MNIPKITREAYDDPDPILDVQMTYFDFLNLLTDAWLETEGMERVQYVLRRALFQKLDDKMREATK